MTDRSRDLTHSKLRFLAKESPAVRLLRAENMPFVASFLFREFRRAERHRIAESDLRLSLAQYLEQLREETGEALVGDAKYYIDIWAREDHSYIRRFYVAGEEDAAVELSSETVRALDYLQSLDRPGFVGAESKIRRIFSLLEDLAVKTNPDPKVRIEDLKQAQQRIRAEIERIKDVGQAEVLTPTQIKENTGQLLDELSGLYGDFRKIYEIFFKMAGDLRQQFLEETKTSGELLGGTLDASRKLEDSDQGKSFGGLMAYLRSDEMQLKAQQYIARITTIPEAVEVLRERYGDTPPNIRALLHGMVRPAQRIIEAKGVLAEQIRKVVSAKSIQESKAIMSLISEIKAEFHKRPLEPGRSEIFWEIEDCCYISLPLDRPLWEPNKTVKFKATPSALKSAPPSLEHISAVFGREPLDLELLKSNIIKALQGRKMVTLGEVIEMFPVSKGLREYIAYAGLAHAGIGVAVDHKQTEKILVEINHENRRASRIFNHAIINIPKDVAWRHE